MIEHLPEIWTPKIGQRVICRPSPECLCKFILSDTKSLFVSAFEVAHPAETLGRTGVVVPPPEGLMPSHESHPILVWFDKPFPLPPYSLAIDHWCFAAAELSPVFALGDRIRVRAAEGYCPNHHIGRPGQLGTIVDRTESPSGHVWTVNLDETESWDRTIVDEFCDEEMEPL